MTRLRGSPGYANAPAGQGQGDASGEAIGRSILTHNDSTSRHPAPQTGPGRRRCPSCRHTDAPSAFRSIAPPPGERGYAWRCCPRCAFIGLLTSFSRVDGGVLPVAVRP